VACQTNAGRYLYDVGFRRIFLRLGTFFHHRSFDDEKAAALAQGETRLIFTPDWFFISWRRTNPFFQIF
jgi:hypothetical protein